MSNLPKKIVVLASGSGSTFEYLAKALPIARIEIVALLCNKGGIGAIDRAEKLGINYRVFHSDEALISELIASTPDLVVLAGYLKKIPNQVIDLLPNKIINVHPSLLPKYGGQGMYGRRVHEAVAAAGEKETGATVHFVNGEYDAGEILAQRRIQLSPNSSPAQIEEAVKKIEKELLAESIFKFFKI